MAKRTKLQIKLTPQMRSLQRTNYLEFVKRYGSYEKEVIANFKKGQDHMGRPLKVK